MEKGMKLLIEEDTRLPAVELNYPNPVNPDPYKALGPNTAGENLWPVAISADGKRIGLSYIGPRKEDNEGR